MIDLSRSKSVVEEEKKFVCNANLSVSLFSIYIFMQSFMS